MEFFSTIWQDLLDEFRFFPSICPWTSCSQRVQESGMGRGGEERVPVLIVAYISVTLHFGFLNYHFLTLPPNACVILREGIIVSIPINDRTTVSLWVSFSAEPSVSHILYVILYGGHYCKWSLSPTVHLRVEPNVAFQSAAQHGNWCPNLLLFSHSVVSNSLQLHELQHTRHACPSLSRGVFS